MAALAPGVLSLAVVFTVSRVFAEFADAVPDAARQLTSTATPNSDSVSRIDLVNSILNLRASRIITMDIDRTPQRTVRAGLVIDDQPVTISLEPHSIRAAGYRLRAQLGDGSLVDVDPGPVRTLRGFLEEIPGSTVAASMMPDGLHGSVIVPAPGGGTRWWLQPLRDRLPNAGENEYALYRNEDVISSPGACGNTEQAAADAAPPPGMGGIAGAGSAETHCARLACDADVEYFQAWGSSVTNVQDQIERVTNQMDLQYVNEVGIDHVITQIIVRTAEPDPYTADAAIPLVIQFRGHWLSNHSDVPRDAAQLFTGRPIVIGAGGYIGYAFQIGAICTNGAYCVSQSDWAGQCCGNLACATDLSAHELGHLWGAFHCNEFCNSTMFPNILCTNTFTNSDPSSIASITAYRNAASCLAVCASSPLPFFDAFATEVIDAGRWMNPVSSAVNDLALNEPSAPYALNLKGQFNQATSITTAPMNTAGAANVQLSYWCQQGGGGDDPNNGADLVVEYINNIGAWLEIDRLFGSDPPQSTFVGRIVPLPADASHSQFRVRFRNSSTANGLDDWFVDDVSILRSPLNDVCAAAPLVISGSHAFTTLLASTDGPDELGGCGVGQVSNDIWFRYGAACAPGTVTVSVCDADFDTRLAVYAGGCPGAPGALACNDDFCGSGSQVSLFVASPQLLRIRVGGSSGSGDETGGGTMVISCTPAPVCPGDANGTGAVDIDDLLMVVNNWGWTGVPGSNDADIAPFESGGDGVVNIDDLLLIVNAWGRC